MAVASCLDGRRQGVELPLTLEQRIHARDRKRPGRDNGVVSSASVSPTAHYTGYVWARNGLSHPALRTAEGRILFLYLQPTMLAARVLAGTDVESFLLARHRMIDRLLEAAIDGGRVSQVIEIAA